MRGFSIFMIVFILIRIVSIFYLAMVLEIKAGFWGLYQMPLIYPFYVVGLILCFIHLSRRDLDHIKVLSFHIFTLVLTFFDVLIYILSINKAWDYWIF